MEYSIKANCLGGNGCGAATNEEDLNNCLQYIRETIKRSHPNLKIEIKQETLDEIIDDYVKEHERDIIVECVLKGYGVDLPTDLTVKALSDEDAIEVVKSKNIPNLEILGVKHPENDYEECCDEYDDDYDDVDEEDGCDNCDDENKYQNCETISIDNRDLEKVHEILDDMSDGIKVSKVDDRKAIIQIIRAYAFRSEELLRYYKIEYQVL